MIICGIDPGLEGAIAFISTDLNVLPIIYKMPVKLMPSGKRRELDMAEILEILHNHNPVLIVIEEVHSMPAQGVASTFTFGKVYGQLLGLAHSITDIHTVSPTVWKKSVCGENHKDKEASILWSKFMYPNAPIYSRNQRPDHNKSDALALAYYGFKKYIKNKINDLNNN